MRGFLQRLSARWQNWCGDFEMETAIRAHLDSAGFYGRSAKLRNVKLVAVQRPGWVQVYRFDCTARLRQDPSPEGPDPEPVDRELFGLVRDDARHRTDVKTYFDRPSRSRQFERWADGLIALRGAAGL